MSTPYQDVYDYFLLKVEDYSFLNLTQQELYGHLKKLLKISITKFKYCKTDLTNKDDVNELFNVDLSDEEKNILASIMVVEYLLPEIATTKLLKQKMTDRDFKMTSQANHLNQLQELYKLMKSEYKQLLKEYSYFHNSLDDLE